MRQAGLWLVAVSMLVALVAGGLLTTFAWLYQDNLRQSALTIEPALTPVPAVAKPASVAPGPTAAATVTKPAATQAPAAAKPAATQAPTAAKPAATQAPTTVKPSATEPAAAFVANVENGRQVYARLCEACHPGGNRGVGPSLRGADFERKFADDAALRAVIRNGQGTMPPFRQLTDGELNDLVAFVRTLD